MSRHDGKFTAADEAPVDAAELLCALATQARAERSDCTDAIARYLSEGEGWREALHRLGGAFADDAAPNGRIEGMSDTLTSALQNIFNARRVNGL